MTNGVVFTIGHSTRSWEEFLELLRGVGVELVADVRTIPKSRHNPQYNKEILAPRLEAAGVGYLHMHRLGGLRRAGRDSLNRGWRNASFQGFADYMQTTEFRDGIESLLAIAKERRTTVMCAEAVPWRCHRSLIGDALVVRGTVVVHILGNGKTKEHALMPLARVRGTEITYPAP